MRIYCWSELSNEEQLRALTRPVLDTTSEVQKTVQTVVEAIKEQRDKALFYYRERFDHASADTPLKLTQSLIDTACQRVEPDIKQAIIRAKSNITKFHEAQKFQEVTLETSPGVQCSQKIHPIECTGLYIPGGTAPLPSTVLMLGVPAILAGCPHIILCSPPPIADEIILAATLCGIDQIYAIGGAQAIAAMALGTPSMPKVDKIFGPGNAYVTEAKQQVSLLPNGAAIDMPAGPSELLVIADETAQPNFVAADLLSQAEHSPDAQVILVTPSKQLITDVISAINLQKQTLPRLKIVSESLSHSRFILCQNLQEAIEISNQYAPEHLSIQTQAPEAWVSRVKHAGSIFVGSWSPESAGDYASGTNHVLPTYGHTRTSSSLGLADFVRRFTVQTLTPSGLKDLGNTITTLARAELLEAHAQAVDVRLEALARMSKEQN